MVPLHMEEFHLLRLSDEKHLGMPCILSALTLREASDPEQTLSGGFYLDTLSLS